jgi:Ca-activated chloride channel family protein
MKYLSFLLLCLFASSQAFAQNTPTQQGLQQATSDYLSIDVQSNLKSIIAEQNHRIFLKLALKGKKIENNHRTPLNIALVIDRSGSMYGDRILQAKLASKAILKLFNQDDIFSLIAYDNDAEVIVPATKVSNPQNIERMIDGLNANGSTALYAGVQNGVQEVKKFLDKNKVNRVILLSDGQANVGPSSPSDLASLGRELGGMGISVSTIGLGLGYNEDLMTQLALQSDGNHVFVENPDQLTAFMQLTFGSALSIVAQKVQVEFTLPGYIKPIQSLGRSVDIVGQNIKANLNQVLSENESFIMIEAELNPLPFNSNPIELANITVKYQDVLAKKEAVFSKSYQLSMLPKGSAVEENAEVQIDALQLKGNERNKEALKLRDRGDIAGAKKMLEDNVREISKARAVYKSKKLDSIENETKESVDNIEDNAKWNKERKKMKKSQFSFDAQQSY